MKQLRIKTLLPFACLALLSIVALFYAGNHSAKDTNTYNQADTVWITIAAALVFLMTTGSIFLWRYGAS